MGRPMKVRQMQIPPPTQPHDFERLCCDLFRCIWRDPNAQLNGRGGQRQNGVDVFGKPTDCDSYYGVQCKVKDRGRGAKLTFKEIVIEVAKADQFVPTLGQLIVATTASRDARLQEQVRLLSEARQREGKFSVSVVAWEDLLNFLSQHEEVAARYYPILGKDERSETYDSSMGAKGATTPDHAAGPTVRSLSDRLTQVVDKHNQNSGEPYLSASRIAVQMGVDKLSTVTRFFDGTDEPTIQFLRWFSEQFGVNLTWLLHGDEQPFYHGEPFVFGPAQAADLIDATLPIEIVFVRSTSPRGECTLILKYGEWRFRTLPQYWHVSSIVGGTGTGHLIELYALILRLKRDKSPRCTGQVLAEKDFERLVEGEVSPRAALAKRHRDHDWWQALPDLGHKMASAPNYGRWYGQSFLDAQSILRSQLLEAD